MLVAQFDTSKILTDKYRIQDYEFSVYDPHSNRITRSFSGHLLQVCLFMFLFPKSKDKEVFLLKKRTLDPKCFFLTRFQNLMKLLLPA